MSGIGRIAALVVLGLATGACAGRSSATSVAGRPVAGASVFDRPWVWSDEQDASVRLSQWRGSSLVVSFVYTSCTTVCPLTVEKLRRLDQRYRQGGRAVEFILVTLDPWTDSAAQLRAFRKERALPAGWHLLRADYAQTHALAELLKVRLIDDGSHVIHDGAIAVTDGAGRPIGHIVD